ncbi:MAG: hypothetical protein ACR2NZ_26150, partial [Rubripirellula sp.]
MRRLLFLAVSLLVAFPFSLAQADTVDDGILEENIDHGIVAVLGSSSEDFQLALDLCKSPNVIVYYQTDDVAKANHARAEAAKAQLLGQRLFVEHAGSSRIEMGNNVADRVLIPHPNETSPSREEILRVVRPHGIAKLGSKRFTKPVPEGSDDWSHPYHGPDNNPQSDDQLVRGGFRTQFIGYPMFSPMPEQSVIANGRIYKAMGHIAHKANQNAMLNTLLCINAFNGTILWRRDLSPGFMLHRNTMVATDDALYLG